MENNEIMVNDEVIEATEEIVETKTGNGLLIAAGVGAALIVGTIIYKKVIKPAIAKAKAKKAESEMINGEFEEIDTNEADS